MMADGSEADASLIMDPNGGIFFSDAAREVSYTGDAQLVTEDGATRVNLHVDCG